MKIIFLDIDGVLNDHKWMPCGSCRMVPACADQLNRLLQESGASVVLSSAWRYMILRKEITLQGFKYLLSSHGVGWSNGHGPIYCPLIGTTVSDEELKGRSKQVSKWLVDNKHFGIEKYIVIDNDDFDFKVDGLQFVQTNQDIGLTSEDVDKALVLLK